MLSLKRVRRRKDEGEDAIGASEEEKERGRKKTTRLPPEMTSPRDLGTETDLDRVNPHQAGLTRPGCSPSLPFHLPTAARVASYYANAMLLGASCCCCCCCGCGHRCCIDRPQHRLPSPLVFHPSTPLANPS